MTIAAQTPPETEREAVAALKEVMWPNGPECSHCGSVSGAAKLKAETTWRCSACKLRFDIRDETPIMGSNAPLHLWLRAIHASIRSSPRLDPEDLARQTRLSVATVTVAQRLVVQALTADNRILRAMVIASGIPADEFDRARGKAMKMEADRCAAEAKKEAKREARRLEKTRRRTQRARAKRRGEATAPAPS